MTEPALAPLFTPVTLGGLALPNRIVMAPLTRSRADADGVPSSFAPAYYAQRAQAGLLVAEATNISAQARGYALTPGIWSPAQVAGWRNVTEAVHVAGGRIVLQLWHTGRFGHNDLQPDGGPPVAPSPIAAAGQAFTLEGLKDVPVPRALRTDEMPGLMEDYRIAARNAKDAGFDGVEIHAANCYLLEQFIRDSTNERDDRYGGGVENRLRAPLEAVEAVLREWDADKVGIRLSPVTPNVGETPLDSDVMTTYGTLYEKLGAYGLAYLHVVEGQTIGPREIPNDVDLDALRRRFNGAYIANNSYTPQDAAQAVAGGVDAVAFGRLFIANPDLVRRLEIDAPLAEAPKDTWYGGGARGYSDWPAYSAR